jgi:Fur family transcriptional regulator, ferric uptake regulator
MRMITHYRIKPQRVVPRAAGAKGSLSITRYHKEMPGKDQRNTRQRNAIREAFELANRPLSPQQVLEAAQTEVEGLGIATVYRNVKALIEEGWLAAVELPGSGTVYERAGKAHHHHFHCDRCSRVFDLSGCLPNINRLAGRRFLVARHELVLYGTCADCRSVNA